MSKFRTLQLVDRQALDPDAKSELVPIGEVVEVTDPGRIEKYVGVGVLEAIEEEAGTPIDTTPATPATSEQP
ncbi:MAG TPA: hypothetical protein VGQ86_09550 [Candidatus Limnocylindria bacterium]|jgi:hypothetical protein|nr:hypothetical protein [Candidatus Limnocylindria bacterium]